MTPAQSALKAYLIAKLGEGVFEGKNTPSAIFRKASAEFAADMPVAASDLLMMMGNSAASLLGQAVLGKVGAVARDISQRGIAVVLTDIRDKAVDMRDKVDMQYQRGVERNRKVR